MRCYTQKPRTTTGWTGIMQEPDPLAGRKDLAKGIRTARRMMSNTAKILPIADRSEEHTSELQSRQYIVCRLLLEKKTKSITRRWTTKTIQPTCRILTTRSLTYASGSSKTSSTV